MDVFCHRCGAEVPARDGLASFCTNCGAPQLYLLDYLREDAPPPQTTGAFPPPDPRGVEWKSALRCAAFVGAIAFVLCVLGSRFAVFSLFSWLWILSGSIIAIGLYQKQQPEAWMDARTGARIGSVVGLALAAGLTSMLSLSGLVARFGTRSMGGFDTDLTRMLHAQVTQMASTTPVPPELMGYFFSQEFRAGLMLMALTLVSAMLLIVSTLGGAFAGLMRARSRAALGV